MKKHLILFFLFVIYIFIILTKEDSKKVFLEQKEIDHSIIDVTLNFKEGINSQKLSTIFNGYTNNYYVRSIVVNNTLIPVSCSQMNLCIKEVFSYNDSQFYDYNITNGFKINSINIISYNDMLQFLSENNINYDIDF